MKTVQKHLPLSRPIKPAAEINTPVVWVRELRILRKLQAGQDEDGDDYEIRRVKLRRGLNIVWAPPEEAAEPAELYEDGIAGHASGKTTFCRVLRYVLGEGNFGPDALREAVRTTFGEAWAVAEVFIGDNIWLVGRTLVPSLHHFAFRGLEIDAFLEHQPPQPRGSFEQFVETLEAACCHRLPSDPRYAWRQLLPWLARDQECRFSAIHLWRNSALSEADAPDTNVADQHLLMRAVLRLMEPKEHKARVLAEASAKDVEKLEADERVAKSKLEEDCNRLDADLLILKDDDTALEEKRKVLTGAGEIIAEELEKLGDDAELTRAQQEILRLSTLQSGLSADVTALKSSVSDTTKDIEMLTDEIQVQHDQARENPARAAEGSCPHTWTHAVARGCVEQQGKLLPPAESPARTFERQRLRLEGRLGKQTRDLASKKEQLANITRELSSAEAAKKAAEKSRGIRLTPLREKHAANAARVERIANIERSRRALKAISEQLTLAKGTLETRRADAIDQRKSADAGLEKFSEVFGDVVRAVMGPQVSAKATVTEKGLTLRIQRNAELQGSALSTIRVLAFDLAALVQSIEGDGLHPRLLIHDGPREADLSRVIYERFFLYAKRMEAETRHGEEPAFQYIVTTTTPPPQEMQADSHWLRMTLNAGLKAERFFRQDL